MARKSRGVTAAAIGLSIAFAATGCAGGSDSNRDDSSDGKVTMTFWAHDPGVPRCHLLRRSRTAFL